MVIKVGQTSSKRPLTLAVATSVGVHIAGLVALAIHFQMDSTPSAASTYPILKASLVTANASNNAASDEELLAGIVRCCSFMAV